MRITMVGTGYVGLVTGTCLANTGNNVTCLDIDAARIERLKAGQMPFYEPHLDELVRRNVKAGRLHFTTEKRKAYESAEIIFICVGTPSDATGQAELKDVFGVAADIGAAIETDPPGGTNEERLAKIIVIKSTVPVGTDAKVKDIIATLTSKPFHLASNPEFLKEGAAVNDFNKPDRVVIGVTDKPTAERLRNLYEPFVRQGNPIFIMDIRSAQMVKYAANAMLATKISFINEIANLCESYGADIDDVRRGMCSDMRIGNQFLYPGLGYGGSCFPKDVLACIEMGAATETPTSLLKAVHTVNQRQRSAFLTKIDRHFTSAPGGLKGKTIAIWGIAFKPGTDDIREAPSIAVMEHLLNQGATVVAHDPVANVAGHRAMGERIRCVDDPVSAVQGAHALVVCTDWDEFKHPDFDQIRQRMCEPVIFDGRNLYHREMMNNHGFTYYCVGRQPVRPADGVMDPRR